MTTQASTATPATLARPSATPTRLGGLDGLRAVAVGLVVVYHIFPEALPGGFLGVDIFFVISGFLITWLLIAEHRLTGKIALAGFWRRRARRLLPALALVLLVSTSAALLAGGKELLVNIGAQLTGASFFVANWVYIALGADYFAKANPELFRNTWSLAIEEQFYVLLPLVLLLAFHMRSRATRVLFFSFLGLASALLMGTLFAQGASATRVYFGTDTHVFGLLLGAALACAIKPIQFRKLTPENSSVAGLSGSAVPLLFWQQLSLSLLGLASFVVLGWLVLTLREGSPESFLGGFQIATLAMLVLVWAATRQGAWLGRALDVQPLLWVGERSYGIYLWHWPVLLIVAQLGDQAGATAWSVAALTLVLTLFLAAVSYRFVEQPVRRIGLRAAATGMFRPLRSLRLRDRSTLIGLTVLLILLITVPATGFAIAQAPAASYSTDVIARGQAVLEANRGVAGGAIGAAGTAGSAGSPGSASSVGSVTFGAAGNGSETGGSAASSVADGADGADGQTGSFGPTGFGTDWAAAPHFEPPRPEPIQGWQIFAVGDSVMLASAPELSASFTGIAIDAAVSRGMFAGVEILQELASRGELREVLVVGLGTNGPVDGDDLDMLVRVADGRGIVLVNAYADRWWVPEVNTLLREFAKTNRGVTLADWAATIPTVAGGLAGDDIHPNPIGGETYAAVVQTGLDALLDKDEQPLPPKGQQHKNPSRSK